MAADPRGTLDQHTSRVGPCRNHQAFFFLRPIIHRMSGIELLVSGPARRGRSNTTLSTSPSGLSLPADHESLKAELGETIQKHQPAQGRSRRGDRSHMKGFG